MRKKVIGPKVRDLLILKDMAVIPYPGQTSLIPVCGVFAMVL